MIQQKKGTVRATGSVGGLPLNDDPVFEQQADRIQAEVGAWTAGTVRREALAYGAGTESGYAPPVVQRVLFTDIPADEKLSGVTDLGIWWAMAAEWHEQGLRAKESEKTGPEKGAKDYIKSLANYVSTASRPAVTLEDGDEARILTHGIDPDRIEKMNKRQYDDLLIMFHAHPNWLNCLEQIKEAELKKAIGLVGQNMPYVLNQVEVQRQANGVDQLVTNIEDALTAGGNSQSVIPAYCYMGNNASDHKERTKRRGETSSLGQGGILSPVSGIVSLNKGNMSSLVNYLQIKYHSSSPQWKDIIFAEEKKFGSWKDINGLCSANGTVKTAWDRLKAWEASSAPDAGELAQFLEILYEVIKPQYEAFLADILQYDSKKSNAGDKVLTGKIPGLWPLSQAELEGEA